MGSWWRGCAWLVLAVILVYVAGISVKLTTQGTWRLFGLMTLVRTDAEPDLAPGLGAAHQTSCKRPQTARASQLANHEKASSSLSVVVSVSDLGMCQTTLEHTIAGIATISQTQRQVMEVVVAIDSPKASETDIDYTDAANCVALWQSSLSPTPVVLVTQGIGPLRSVNRALRIASGAFILLIDEVDPLPTSPKVDWIARGLLQMQARSDLGLLSPSYGSMWDYTRSPATKFTFGPGSINQTLPFVDKTSSLPFMFVECVGTGPLFVRRRLIDVVGGYATVWEQPGDPKSFFHNCILSYEAWSRGYTAAIFDAGDRLGEGGEAARTHSDGLHHHATKTAEDYMHSQFSRHQIHNGVVRQNEAVLSVAM